MLVRLCRNHALEARLRQHFGEQLTAAHLKMADTPAGAALELYWPHAACHANILSIT